MFKCAIVIPIYKSKLQENEFISLIRCIKIFENKRDIILIAPQCIDIDYLKDKYQSVQIKYVNSIFLSTYENYSRMCMFKGFYENFIEYDYILIYQLDAYVFQDDIDYFLEYGYDYYGAPIVFCPSWGGMEEMVGCGGLSLRKVSKFIEASFEKFDSIKYIAEDLYFCRHSKIDINKCPVNIAMKFCFSAETNEVLKYWYNRTNGTLPSFVHIFDKNDVWNFWNKFIDKYADIKPTHFITFANRDSGFSTDRIKYEAKEIDCFCSINSYSELDFDNIYWEKNKEHFNNTRGYGYWSWKPYFILKKLKEIDYGETVVYADTGCSIVKNNKLQMLSWILNSQKSKSGILSPCFGPFYERNWTKGDTYKYINDTYNHNKIDIFENAIQCGAGILIVTKTNESIKFMERWNDIMENHFELCTDEVSKTKSHPQFREHRHDQSIFSMLSKIYPIETINSYDGILNKNSPILCTRCKNDKDTWKRPLKVVYDNQIFDLQKFGGISRVFVELYKRQSINPIISNFCGGENYSKYPKINPLITVSNTDNQNYKELNIKNNIILSNTEYTKKILLEKNFDIFFPTFFNCNFLDMIGDKKYVVFIPDMISEIYPHIFGTTHPYITGKRKIANGASAIFTASNNSKNDIMKIFNISGEKIHVIPHGITEDFGKYVYKKSFFDFPYILFVGERDNYKNFIWLLKNIAHFLLENSDIKLVCTGRPFNDYEQKIIHNIGLDNSVVCGYVENNLQMATLYYYAKMFVFPSEYEGFGIPILEAYEMKCPVLLNNDNMCFHEIAGNAAIYFNKNNIEERIKYIINMNEKERSELISNQSQRLKLYDWDKAARIVEDVLIQISK